MLCREIAGHVPTESGRKREKRMTIGGYRLQKPEECFHRVLFKCLRPNLLLYHKLLRAIFKELQQCAIHRSQAKIGEGKMQTQMAGV